MVNYLRKPFATEKLVEAVHKALAIPEAEAAAEGTAV